MSQPPKTTADMEDRAEELRRDLEETREEYAGVLREAKKAKERAEEARDRGEYDEEAEERYEKLSARARALKSEMSQTEGVIETFEEKMEEWGGSEFTIKRLGWTEAQGARDEVSRASYTRDRETGEVGGIFRQGMFEVKVTALAVVDGPPNAPPTIESNEVPPDVGAWLYECVEDFNSAGGVGLSDFSMEEELAALEETEASN